MEIQSKPTHCNYCHQWSFCSVHQWEPSNVLSDFPVCFPPFLFLFYSKGESEKEKVNGCVNHANTSTPSSGFDSI